MRSRLGFTASDIADADVNSFIAEAAAILCEEAQLALDSGDCTESQANAIANLAAIYCYCKITGIASTGWTVNLGTISFSGPAERVAQLEFLKKQVQSWIERNREIYVGSA